MTILKDLASLGGQGWNILFETKMSSSPSTSEYVTKIVVSNFVVNYTCDKSDVTSLEKCATKTVDFLECWIALLADIQSGMLRILS